MLVQDINPFGVRMPADLKKALEKESKINGRSLNSEVVDRLKRSLEQPAPRNRVESAGTSYAAPVITDAERQMFVMFRKWSPDKQLAFLTLFK